MKVEIFMEIQPQYRYMKLPSGEVDIFIYKFIEEKQRSEDEENSKEYLYEFNSFRVKQNEITEKMIKDDPFKYLEYSPKEKSQEETMAELQKKVRTLEETIEQMNK